MACILVFPVLFARAFLLYKAPENDRTEKNNVMKFWYKEKACGFGCML